METHDSHSYYWGHTRWITKLLYNSRNVTYTFLHIMVHATMMGVPQRGTDLRTVCLENLILVWTLTLFVSFMVITFPIIYELCENSKEVSSFWPVSLALRIIVIDLFQALLLEQINDSTTLRKNLEM